MAGHLCYMVILLFDCQIIVTCGYFTSACLYGYSSIVKKLLALEDIEVFGQLNADWTPLSVGINVSVHIRFTFMLKNLPLHKKIIKHAHPVKLK